VYVKWKSWLSRSKEAGPIVINAIQYIHRFAPQWMHIIKKVNSSVIYYVHTALSGWWVSYFGKCDLSSLRLDPIAHESTVNVYDKLQLKLHVHNIFWKLTRHSLINYSSLFSLTCNTSHTIPSAVHYNPHCNQQQLI